MLRDPMGWIWHGLEGASPGVPTSGSLLWWPEAAKFWDLMRGSTSEWLPSAAWHICFLRGPPV